MTPEERPDPEVALLEVLRQAAMYKRPRAAIAAFRALTAVGAFDAADRGLRGRLTGLVLHYRPRVAAAAVKALVELSRARKRVPR
jgi:hypothetical protein